MDPDTKLAPHFAFHELIDSEVAARHGWDNTPIDPAIIANLYRVAAKLEEVRVVVEAPVLVTSGYRSQQVNQAVGSKETSQHRLGCAADFKVPGCPPFNVIRAILTVPHLLFDQLIWEYDSWTHISVPSRAGDAPRRNVLIIDAQSPSGRSWDLGSATTAMLKGSGKKTG